MKAVIICSRIVWRLVTTAIISLAVLITLGRQFAHELPRYQAQLEDMLSGQVNMQVAFNQIKTEWTGFSPLLSAAAVSLSPLSPQGAGQPVITTEKLNAHPDFFRSLVSRTLLWHELSVERLTLSLVEQPDGRWSLGGMTSGGGMADTAALLKMMRRSTYLKISEGVFHVAFSGGDTSIIRMRDILVENSGDFHRVAVSAAFDDAGESARLVIEGRHDLFDINAFQGAAYLKLNRLNFQGPVSAMVKRWVPALAEQADFDSQVEAEFWMEKPDESGAHLSGYIKAAEIPLFGQRDTPPLTGFKAEVTGVYHPGRDWQVVFQDIDFDWAEHAIEPLTIGYRQKVGEPLGFGTVGIDHLNLTTLAAMLESGKLLSARGMEVLQTLQPSGVARALRVHLRPTAVGQPKFAVQANLQDVAISSWKKAPASRGINGYVEMDGINGFLELDSPNGFAMHYPSVYADYMVYPTVRGQIGWRIDQERQAVRVASGPITLGGETGEGTAYLYLDLPFKRAQGPGEMFLQLGLRNSHSRYRNRFIPKTMKPGLRKWLDEAVGDAALDEVGFVWRGSLSGKARQQRSTQLYLKIRDGELKFRPDWPALQALDAVVAVDDRSVTGEVADGRIGDMNVTGAQARVTPAANGKGSVLAVTGSVRGDAGDAVRVLAQSPLQDRVGGLVDWPLSGKAAAELDLTIPLAAGAAKPSYKVDADISEAQLADPEKALVFQQVAGKLRYRDDTGLSGRGLRASLWGKIPLTGAMATVEDELVLTSHGSAGLVTLFKQFGLPLDAVLTGETDFQGELYLGGGGPPRLQLNSSFLGVAVDLPEPFGKAPGAGSGFEMSVTFNDGFSRFTGNHNHQLYFAFDLADGAISNGLLSVNKPARLDDGRKELRLDGLLHDFTLDEWLPVYERLRVFGGGENSLPQRITAKLDFFRLDELELGDMVLTGEPTGTGTWVFTFTSDIAAGKVTLPRDKTLPFEVELESLNFPASESEKSESESIFAGINPAELPHVDFHVDKLSVGGKLLGSVSFLMQPREKGVMLSNIDGKLLGVILGTSNITEEDERGASPLSGNRLVWLREGEENYTHFTGLFGARDIADALGNWSEAKIIDSERARFVTDLSWRGPPDKVTAESLYGSLVMELQDGEFYRSPKGATGTVIRAVGLLNFANWVRRIKLDFSDLFSEGMKYDMIKGVLKFDYGVMAFESPVEVKMPSGRMKLSGSADLLGEQLDAHLVMTVPVETNLPWFVALAGGLPAAAGVYVTSKLFEKQLGSLSSLSYKIDGGWDDPTLKVDRIFSDKGVITGEAANGKPGAKRERANE